MKFMEAVEAMKQGKKVRRCYCSFDYIYLEEGKQLISTNDGKLFGIWLKDIEATDWEVVEEPKNTLWDKKDQSRIKDKNLWYFTEDFVKQALKEYRDWVFKNTNCSAINEYPIAKEIFGEELITSSQGRNRK